MSFDAYSPCPCGSGKKFKWCCQPIYVQMDKAFRQEAEGQHDAALRLMDEVVAEHPDNPEAWGRRAELLYQNGRFDDAENSLQKALEVSPNYPFGHLLRGMFRQNEGEIPGALLLYRKAADLYDPEARDLLGVVYSRIADCEFRLNRPVAARAAMKMALRCQPASEEMRQAFEELFGAGSRLPESARKEYAFQSPPADTPAERRAAWDRALADPDRFKLGDAARAFERLAEEDPRDAAAWYDLGLTRAWLGDNGLAVDALEHYVGLEGDESKAAAAWALAEVLLSGYGMEDRTDRIEHSAVLQIRNPEQVFGFLQQWEGEHRIISVQIDQEHGVISGLVLDRVTALTPDSPAAQAPGLGAYLLAVAEFLRLWNTSRDALERVLEDVKKALGPALTEPRMEQRPAAFQDVLSEALCFPIRAADKDQAQQRVEEHVQRYFEDVWVHRPLRSLNQVPPVDAAGHPALRKRLLGIVGFLQECAGGSQVRFYDFDRLRRKLGLSGDGAVPRAAAAAPGPDVEAMGAAELAALKPEGLADDVLERAYQAAVKLDARDLAGRFARTLVGRPADGARPDRYPWYSHLVQLALGEGDTGAALDLLREGDRADREHNQGRRHGDYELRRAQIHAKRGDADEAQQIFDRLIQEAPGELRYRGSAAEAMLSARQGPRALGFAEAGLAKAREKNDRDSEEYFQELVAAARKQAGG